MHLIQIYVPLFDNLGRRLPQAGFATLRRELTERFGGLTAFVQAPALGLWKAENGATARDEVILIEVMAESIDRAWWTAYRRELEARFRQAEIVVRALVCERL